MRSRSIFTNLRFFNDFLSQALERSYQVDTVYTDFSQAFDTVNHSHLVDRTLIDCSLG